MKHRSRPPKRARSVSTSDVGDDTGERLISRYIVAERLDCEAQTITRMVKEGRFVPPFHVGRLLRWRERDVNEWIAERAAAAKKIAAAAAKSIEPRKRAARDG
jgi:predicted DNA-binding transcriptional regulator AlpA